MQSSFNLAGRGEQHHVEERSVPHRQTFILDQYILFEAPIRGAPLG